MHPEFGYGMMGGQRFVDGGFGSSFGPIAFFGFLLVGAAVVALIVWLIARKAGRPAPAATASQPWAQSASTEDAALAIARERLARGEIDPDQYTAIAAALKNHPTIVPS